MRSIGSVDAAHTKAEAMVDSPTQHGAVVVLRRWRQDEDALLRRAMTR
ncbi:hypothetical protein [Xanthomonas hortorum]